MGFAMRLSPRIRCPGRCQSTGRKSTEDARQHARDRVVREPTHALLARSTSHRSAARRHGWPWTPTCSRPSTASGSASSPTGTC